MFRPCSSLRAPWRVALLLLLWASSIATAQIGDDEPAKPKKHSTGWSIFNRPAKSNPEEQLAYAQQLRAEGRRGAAKQFRALVAKWPVSKEAWEAQLAYAQLMDERGKYFKAFDEYQWLVDEYAGRFPGYDGILQRQFELAMLVKQRRKADFLFFPGFLAPEDAIPMLESIVANGPRWEKAPEAQFLVGQIYEEGRNYELAIVAYSVVQYRYPDSEYAERASYGFAYCLYQLALENRHSEEALEEAFAAMSLFLSKYPDSERATLAKEYRKTLLRRMAGVAFEQAEFYDRIARKKDAALLAYQNFVQRFPNSEWTGLAEIRIDALSKEVEPAP